MVKSTTKKSTKKVVKNEKPEPITLDPKIIFGIPVILLVVVLVIIAGILHASMGKINEDHFTYTGTIDCQPVLSESQAKLCEEAEKSGYKNIVY